MVLSEPVLVVVGIGTLAFTLIVSKLMAAHAARTLEMHFLHVKAGNLRNTYHRQIIALREPAPANLAPQPPIDSGVIWAEPEPVLARAA